MDESRKHDLAILSDKSLDMSNTTLERRRARVNKDRIIRQTKDSDLTRLRRQLVNATRHGDMKAANRIERRIQAYSRSTRIK